MFITAIPYSYENDSSTIVVSVEVNISIYCYSADIRIYLLLDNELDRKIDVTAILFILV